MPDMFFYFRYAKFSVAIVVTPVRLSFCFRDATKKIVKVVGALQVQGVMRKRSKV